MKLRMNISGNTLLVRVSGELDLVVADEFRNGVDRKLDEHPVRNLIINLQGVKFIDSSGLGAILGRYKRISACGGKVAVVGAAPQVKRVLELSGILKIMSAYDKEEQALQAL
jgi:stage II sporulation protein AA (anti-sigma F factor antagonist)